MARHRWATASSNRSTERLERVLMGSPHSGSEKHAPEVPLSDDRGEVGGGYLEAGASSHAAGNGESQRFSGNDGGPGHPEATHHGQLHNDAADTAPLRARRRWAAARRAVLLLSGLVLVIGFWALSNVDRSDGVIVPIEAAGQAAGGVETGPGGGQESNEDRSVDTAVHGGASKGSSPDGSTGGAAPPEGESNGGGETANASGQGQGNLFVHVAGAVTSPGVVEAPSGSRVFEVVDLAGGALPDAQLSAVNLAAVVQDGQQITIPRQGEAIPPAAASAPPAGDVAAVEEGVGDAQPGAGSALVNLNTAGLNELMKLPRVGPVLAERIVQWRTDHGAFTSTEGLDAVPGIGPAMLDALLPLVTI